MSEGLAILLSVLTLIAAGKVWLELLKNIVLFIPFHIFFKSLILS